MQDLILLTQSNQIEKLVNLIIEILKDEQNR